jgi:hypothetical protein
VDQEAHEKMTYNLPASKTEVGGGNKMTQGPNRESKLEAS